MAVDAIWHKYYEKIGSRMHRVDQSSWVFNGVGDHQYSTRQSLRLLSIPRDSVDERVIPGV